MIAFATKVNHIKSINSIQAIAWFFYLEMEFLKVPVAQTRATARRHNNRTLSNTVLNVVLKKTTHEIHLVAANLKAPKSQFLLQRGQLQFPVVVNRHFSRLSRRILSEIFRKSVVEFNFEHTVVFIHPHVLELCNHFVLGIRI